MVEPLRKTRVARLESVIEGSMKIPQGITKFRGGYHETKFMPLGG
jgi:hypothetical protein